MEHDPNSKPPRIFVTPEVIELHLEKHTPLPEGLVKLIWVLDQLFRKEDDGQIT